MVHPMRSSWNMWEPTWVSRSRCWLLTGEASRSCPYGFGSHADMAETTLRSITNIGIWIPMLVPTCSTMISSDEPRCQGFNQSHIQFPLSIGTILARDSIVGIPIPCSILLPASLFTRTAMHDPVTNALVTLSSL